jgi:hypothetical protein
VKAALNRRPLNWQSPAVRWFRYPRKSKSVWVQVAVIAEGHGTIVAIADIAEFVVAKTLLDFDNLDCDKHFRAVALALLRRLCSGLLIPSGG